MTGRRNGEGSWMAAVLCLLGLVLVIIMTGLWVVVL